MMAEIQTFALQTYVVLTVIGLILIPFRADRKLIFEDLKEYFDEKPILAILSVILIVIIAPLTIFFSIAHFPKKKK
jgi:uncharacterized membrane protein YdjX (TVP38/TMEM64 family)